MRRGDYWLVFLALCERYPLGVELTYDCWWECRVRTPHGIRVGKSDRLEGAVEVVASNLGIGLDAARAAAKAAG